jgi:eight-cysteine-cluster-containing protein
LGTDAECGKRSQKKKEVTLIWILLLTMACNYGQPAGKPSAKELAPSEPISSVVLADPAASYAACEERVERPEEAGECSADSACVQAGCSGELCVAETSAKEAFSSCEQRLCFNALDSCSCQEGRCRWTLKEAAPDPPVSRALEQGQR